jgi:gas vesicle protein
MLDKLEKDDDANPRTQAMLRRLHKAMLDIEAQIAQHHGVYPYNHGRVTQSELCRRADVKKSTLQTPLHKETTRVEVMTWLDRLSVQLADTRDATRERVTAVADDLTHELQALKAELAQAQARIAALLEENARLRKPTYDLSI